MPRKRNEENETVLLITFRDGKEQRITIPVYWKVTFGSLNPGTKGESRMALRIYESETKQRACFTEVESFRDISIPIEEKIKKSQRKTAYLRDEEAGEEHEIVGEMIVEEWVNPDSPRSKTKGNLELPNFGSNSGVRK